MAGSVIAQNFQKFVSIFSPSYTGGVLNMAFKPIQTATGTTLLDINDFSMDKLVDYAKQLFLGAKQTYPVLEVLPKELQPADVKNSTYLIQIVLLGVAFLITLGMVFGVLIIPCTWCCCRKRKSQGKSPSRVCYIVMMAVSGAFLLYLGLCLPLVFVSITSVGAGIDGNSSNADNRGFKETFAVVVTQTSEFLVELPARGRKITDELITSAQKSLDESLTELVKTLLDQLLQAYGARALINDAKALNEEVANLENITSYLVDTGKTTVQAITTFQDNMKNHKTSLETDLQSLCTNNPPPQECTQLQDELKKLQFDFQKDQLKLTEIEKLIDLTKTFGGNLTDVLNKFEQMEKDVDQRIEQIIQDIKTKIDLKQQLSSLSKIWDQVETDVSTPVIRELNSMQPTVDSSMDMVSKYIKIGGYAVLALFSVVLVILLINWIIIVVQAALDRTPSSTAITAQMVCGLVIPAIICFLVPLLVLVGGAVILVTGLVSNEGCRYIGDPKGVAITDGAANLYLQYMWPKQFQQNLDPSLQGLLDIPIPQNVLDGLLYKCHVSGPSSGPGFLPSIGVTHFLNATAVLDQPQLKTAITNAENELVKQIQSIKFGDMLKFDITEIKKLITNVNNMLTNTDYSQQISELEKGLVEPKPIEEMLDKFQTFVNNIPSDPPEKQNMQKTITAMRNDLTSTNDLNLQVKKLIDAFKALQAYGSISQKLTQFGDQLQTVHDTLTDQKKLEAPIRPVFKTTVDKAMGKLVTILEDASNRFTAEVITCNNLNKILTSVVGVSCGNDGLINRIGAFFFMLLLFLCPLELTVMLFQITVKTHGKMLSG